MENTLLAFSEVTQAAATLHHTTTGDHLIAYVSGVPEPDPEAVRARVGAWLPDYMVPSQIVVLEELPLTSSGKIDRKSLPAPVFAATAFRAPQTDTEKIVAEVFADVLSRDRVGLDDDFFALGGDSIVSIQLVSTCATRGVDFSVREVFECRTVGRLADAAEMSTEDRHAGALHASDLTLDKFIDVGTLATAPTLPRANAHVRNVLLTGATGFLGRFLALEWLERLAHVDGKLICLVRADSDEDARRRLDKTFDTGDPELWAHYRELAARHLVVVAGDKGEANLGLDKRTWQQMAASLDMIVDSAALVSHALPYSQLFGPNVVGTAELIRLAMTTTIKPYTYVSTMGVAMAAEPPVLDEEPDIRVVNPTRKIDDSLANGYNNSKWAGEVLLREANDLCGLPVGVFRCATILTDTRYMGHLNLPDLFTRLILSLVATDLAPFSFYERDADGKRQRAHFDALPVDFIAEAITTLGEQVRTGVETYNVINPYDDGIGLDEYVDWLVEAGQPIERIDDNGEWLQRFRTALEGLPERQREYTVLPLLHYLPDYEQPHMPLGGALASAERFRAAVQKSKVGPDKDIPHVTKQLIVKYLENLQLIGLVQRPTTLELEEQSV
ncbi:thioester reductase domain-containing protein [Mycobacterium sp.]|uniref:thioester reductase domain-containing protein n=1 Tax=Mycobacterium sp. TaxID=1785 RepID=UPI00260CCF64|nr:thioester reductase domain-containing protein [Mycobacterium sp.]